MGEEIEERGIAGPEAIRLCEIADGPPLICPPGMFYQIPDDTQGEGWGGQDAEQTVLPEITDVSGEAVLHGQSERTDISAIAGPQEEHVQVLDEGKEVGRNAGVLGMDSMTSVADHV